MRTSNFTSRVLVTFLIPVIAGIFGVIQGCSSTNSLVDRASLEASSGAGTTLPISISSRKFIKLTVETGDQSSQFLLYPSLATTMIFQGDERGFTTDDSFIRQRRGSEREVQMDPVQIGSMSVGPVSALLTNRERVRRLSTILAKENLDQVEGVLGYDFLRDKQLTVDYPERKIRLEWASPSPVSAVLETLKPGKTDFDLVDTADTKRMITFQAGVNGNYRTEVALDLGIPVNLMHGATQEKWNLELLSDEDLRQRHGAASSEFDFVSFSRFWIGGRVYRRVLVRLREQMKSRLKTDANVILGNYFFTDKVVQINFPQRWIGIQLASDQTEK